VSGFGNKGIKNPWFKGVPSEYSGSGQICTSRRLKIPGLKVSLPSTRDRDKSAPAGIRRLFKTCFYPYLQVCSFAALQLCKFANLQSCKLEGEKVRRGEEEEGINDLRTRELPERFPRNSREIGTGRDR